MDFFATFFNHVMTSMPVVTKVAYVSMHIKKYLKELERDDKFRDKLVRVLKLFIDKKITLDNMCAILDATDGVRLTRSQIQYFCDRVYYNGHVMELLQRYVDEQHIGDEAVDYLSEFLVHEINNAIICG
ncbi:LdOrf-84 peptide [Lymantria dispar multiple nucleopolyhedrovirus]|jgi:hypothetical protein|uniref:Ac75 n=1 Tax=Lymantria dispar multicapsid nuclear polyhedrosis virus TaxID=10449 RepID=Q9YMP3_NPVLD|nr:LdOrf-84 peptide [Lymantria dispar multiple nucleopolyhedrovirus]AAC70270.1 LdOrf-84 peptide [Lymantria dispar multiple nucleopolyhedrovirus]AHC69585.1 ORF-84 protein [Lymantria dispar multiple nucleopolyhedrovirus]AIX47923.1 hypothetical protein [Lymantria dispar multiple nucleopolyhedrovirus]AJR20358.1 orf-82 protein [Lymantria dispar multiple nucleopolyhedrovirus]AMO27580.1 hypothetical protein [Lymantria dispar multiple nucleopolyhedrovirus]